MKSSQQEPRVLDLAAVVNRPAIANTSVPSKAPLRLRRYGDERRHFGLFRATAAFGTAALLVMGAPPASADVDFSGCAWVAQTSLAPGVNFASYGAVVAGERLVYVGFADPPSGGALYSAPIDGSAPPVQLSATPGPGLHGASLLAAAPNGNNVVYVRETILGRFDLYVAPLASSGGEVLLTAGGSASATIDDVQLTPDGSRVVFISDRIVDGRDELFSVPLDGSSGPIRLNAEPAPSGEVVVSPAGFRLTPDSSHVVYRGDLLIDGRAELFSAPVAAEGGQVHLNGTPVAGGGVHPNFELTPDGSRVVYFADLLVDELYVLYSAPVGAPAGQTQLSPLPSGGGVRWFEITPDSSRVIYVSADDSEFVEEVFSAPIATAGAEIELSQGITDSQVTGMALTPTGSHVVYTADMLVDERFDLYSAPVGSSGSQAALAVSATGGSVVSGSIYEFTQDGATVAFFGELDSGALDVYSASVGVAGSHVRLSSGGTSGVVTEAFSITPDGSRVVYTGDFGGLSPDVGIFSAPLGVAGAQVQISSAGDGLAIGLLFPDRFTADGRWVLYTADPAGSSGRGIYAARVDSAGTEVPLTPPDQDLDSQYVRLVGTYAVLLAQYDGADGPLPSSLWLGDADGDSTFDTCDADLVPQITSATATRSTITVMFDRATNQPSLAGLDGVLSPPAGHSWGAATVAWTSPSTLVITRAGDTTVTLGDVLDIAGAAGVRAPLHRSPLLVGPVATIRLCPPAPPSTAFTDIASSFALADIACLYGAGIVAGTSATTYAPELAVTREQMAVYLMGAHETALGFYTGSQNHTFTDVAGSYATTRIGQLSNLGITAGTSPTTYSPAAPVTRAQMAVFLVRLYEALTGTSPASADATFTDIAGSFAETQIRQLVALGVTAGTSATTYSPDQAVTREQMAVFVVRLLEAT